LALTVWLTHYRFYPAIADGWIADQARNDGFQSSSDKARQ
jgi:hypothetical protein